MSIVSDTFDSFGDLLGKGLGAYDRFTQIEINKERSESAAKAAEIYGGYGNPYIPPVTDGGYNYGQTIQVNQTALMVAGGALLLIAILMLRK